MKDLIKNCFYDKLSPEEAKSFIERCYSEKISIEKINKIYSELKK